MNYCGGWFFLWYILSMKVVDPPPRFVFRVVSGPVVYTAISVINALRRSGRRFLSVSPSWTIPDRKYQIHTGKWPFNKLSFCQCSNCLCWPLNYKLDSSCLDSVQCCSLFPITLMCVSATSVRAFRKVWPWPLPKCVGAQRNQPTSQCMWVGPESREALSSHMRCFH